jgi:acetoin utilization protein AcuC
MDESVRYVFPASGFPDEVCVGDGRGSSLNVPLAPATPGEVWLEAFDAVVPLALEAFCPEVLVTQLGCDTHVTDPLAHLALTTADYGEVARRLHDLAHRHATGRWVATGGGGYQLASVVPRAWTIYFAEQCGVPVPDALPEEWLSQATAAVGERPPDTFWEGPVSLSAERVAAVRAEALGSVESLKNAAFDLLERLT